MLQHPRTLQEKPPPPPQSRRSTATQPSAASLCESPAPSGTAHVPASLCLQTLGVTVGTYAQGAPRTRGTTRVRS